MFYHIDLIGLSSLTEIFWKAVARKLRLLFFLALADWPRRSDKMWFLPPPISKRRGKNKRNKFLQTDTLRAAQYKLGQNTEMHSVYSVGVVYYRSY